MFFFGHCNSLGWISSNKTNFFFISSFLQIKVDKIKWIYSDSSWWIKSRWINPCQPWVVYIYILWGKNKIDKIMFWIWKKKNPYSSLTVNERILLMSDIPKSHVLRSFLSYSLIGKSTFPLHNLWMWRAKFISKESLSVPLFDQHLRKDKDQPQEKDVFLNCYVTVYWKLDK